MEPEFDAFTMGFSNRSWEETIVILESHRIERLVDIRTLPGSRRTPQFNLENLQQNLPKAVPLSGSLLVAVTLKLARPERVSEAVMAAT